MTREKIKFVMRYSEDKKLIAQAIRETVASYPDLIPEISEILAEMLDPKAGGEPELVFTPVGEAAVS